LKRQSTEENHLINKEKAVLQWFGFCATKRNGDKHKLIVMARDVKGKKVAILTENGFEEVELTSPMNALQQVGAEVHIISPQKDKVKAWNHDHWSIEVPVDKALEDASPEDYDMLLLPGGVLNPDKLRMNPRAVQFAQHFIEQGKPLAAICHGPQLLIETGMLDGRTMTSYPSLQTDLRNAGVNWVDQEVVVDNGLVTSRKPDDLEAFNKKVLEELSEGQHATTGQFTHHDRKF
jgi:protease I